MKHLLLASQLSLLSCESEPLADPTPTLDTNQPDTNAKKTSVLWNADSFSPPDFMTDELRSALEKNKFNTALTLIPSTTTEGQVLSTWLAIQQNQANTVTQHYDAIATYESIPEEYRNFILGTLKLSEENDTAATRHFLLLSKDSPLNTQAQWMTVQHALTKDTPTEAALKALQTLLFI